MAQFKLMETRYPSLRHTAGRTSLVGVCVLIVEDEPVIALDLHAALSAVGAGIIAATNATEALQLIRRNDISAAVIDIRLGDRDCGAVCQALFHHRVPFLFHTAHASAAIRQAWPQVPVLIKPVTHQEIVARVAQLVY
jgi:DNA-binding response OmpR family regulator